MLHEPTKKNHYIWVNVAGGVQGYLPEDIYEFEQTWKVELKLFLDRYWDFFNMHFEIETGENLGATSFSSICSDSVAWDELNRLRRGEE